MTAGPAAGVAVGGPVTLESHRSKLRRDVEGLRAVAVLSVLIYHAGVTLFPGGFIGVDIFFVISGFLITSLLIREADKTGRISLKDFYARRARRLLPAASGVLVFSAIGTAWLYSGSEARAFGGDIAAAAANIANWRFAARSVDYLAEDTGASPVLHFWSLAVEEQYYLVWPILAVAALLIAVRLGRSFTSVMAIGLLVVGVASFAWSMLIAESDPAQGFFVTTTRIWELGVGAGVALAIPLLKRMPGRVAGWLAFLGAMAIVVALVVSNQNMAWPGSAALLPVLGTVAVIAAGVSTTGTWTARMLSLKPMVWIGGLSYSLYLWHWPLLVFAEQYRGYLGVKGGVIISLAAFVPAYLSQRLIENPIRFSRQRLADRGRMLLLGALLIAVGVGSGFAVVAANPRTERDTVANGTTPDLFLGARALGRNPGSSPEGLADASIGPIYPAPADAPDDVPGSYEHGCQAQVEETVPTICEVGDPNGDIQILATGDSKMLQYYGVLDAIGKTYGWSIEFATKSSCNWIAAVQEIHDRPYDECFAFGERVTDYMERMEPDYVLTSGGMFRLADRDETTDQDRAQVLAQRWRDAQAMGADVIVLLENPYPVGVVPVYECVEANLGSLVECAFDQQTGVNRSAAPSQVLASKGLAGVSTLTLNDYICPQDSCSPVIGNVMVYRQGSHLTNTYAMSLEDVMGERLAEIIVDGALTAGPVPRR